MEPRLSLKRQVFGSTLRHQTSLTTYVRNPDDLTRLICSSEMSSQLDLSIPSGILGVQLACLAMWKKETSHFWCQSSRRGGPRQIMCLS